MSKKFIILSMATAAVLGPSCARAADIKFIANPSVMASDVSMDDLKRVFLVTKNSLGGGSHVEPVLEKSGPAHEAFLKEVAGKSDAALSIYYRSLVFTGKASMPKTLDSDAAVAAYVAKTRGAIGYISISSAAPGAKILEVK
jgi:hypothetical protein